MDKIEIGETIYLKRKNQKPSTEPVVKIPVESTKEQLNNIDFSQITTLEELCNFIDNHPDFIKKIGNAGYDIHENSREKLKKEIQRVSTWWNQSSDNSKKDNFDDFKSTFRSYGIDGLINKLREIFEKRDTQ